MLFGIYVEGEKNERTKLRAHKKTGLSKLKKNEGKLNKKTRALLRAVEKNAL